MKTAKIIKSCDTSPVTMAELELINQYTRREFSADEVYVFSVVLCDNDIDRDFERFTVESLFALEKLFVGKTGVFDHNPKAQNQTARIFACKVESVDGKKTATGDEYFHLVARAYLPKSGKNKDIILSLDSGIQKEVSVGCAVSKNVCSICGEEINSHLCSHKKGKVYGDKLCYSELLDPYDAYEWSFVAVPAQTKAGVIKSYNSNRGKVVNMEEIIKALSQKGEVTLTQQESQKLSDYVAGLQKQAQIGAIYKQDLEDSVVRLSLITQPEIAKSTVQTIVKKLTVEELKEFKSVYEKHAAQILPSKPQLARKDKSNVVADKNTEFKI